MNLNIEKSSYEIIYNSNNIILSIDSEFKIQEFKFAFIKENLCIKTIHNEIIKFPKMSDKIVDLIKKNKKILIAQFLNQKIIDAIEIKILN